MLHSTNNFPEFTGRVCPAPCEAACTLNINDDPVGIKSIEHFIIDKGWEEGWVAPQPPARKTGKRVAVVGSGPAGLACAQQLARAGHDVVAVREERPHRRPAALRHSRLQDGEAPDRPAHGADVGRGRRVPAERRTSASTCRRSSCSTSSTRSRSPAAPSSRATCRCRAASSPACTSRWSSCRSRTRSSPATRVPTRSSATGKHVVVIGGGDTGSDCVGTSNRQGAQSVTQFELLPQPPEQENKPLVWPYWPIKLRTSSSHEEGCERDWAVATKRFEGSERQGREARRRARRVAEGRRRADEDGRGAGHRVRRSRPTSCCSRWASPARCTTGLLEQFGVARDRAQQRQGEHRRLPHVGRRRSSPPATCAAASRSSCGRSAKAASARASVDEFLMGATELAALSSAARTRWRPSSRSTSTELAPGADARSAADSRCARSKRAACWCCRTSSFALTPAERRFLSPAWSDGRAKNISLDGDALRARAARPPTARELAAMIGALRDDARGARRRALPALCAVRQARAHELPAAARRSAASVSWRKDDSRLHVDAFPSRPNRRRAHPARVLQRQSRRADRVWRVGEPFEAMAQTLLPRMRVRFAGAAARARGAARHQGRAQRVRPPDARAARSREGGSRLPARIARSRSCASRRARRGSASPTR